MNSRTYYGEYSLEHWIKLMLTKNIVLPDYQRSFVWEKDNIDKLLESFNENLFVQPVTIAYNHLASEHGKANLILDGQQRLTSILLAYLGYIPDKTKFEDGESYASEDDSRSDDVDIKEAKTIKWTFHFLLEEASFENTLEKVRARIEKDGRYVKYENSGLRKDFWNNTFLGFSYIISESKEKEKIQKCYAKMFRNINYYGKHLSALESRRSLYFMNMRFKDFFDGLDTNGEDVLCGIMIKEDMKSTKIDFVKYLSILSQYYPLTEDKIKEVLKGYSAYKSREAYYADYVAYLLGLEQESREDKFCLFNFDAVFPSDCWKTQFVKLKTNVSFLKAKMNLEKGNLLTSWIDADYWLFGLIYFIVFKQKGLTGDMNRLAADINSAIAEKRKDENYVKNTNRIGNLRDRILKSIEIYGKYTS